MTYTDPVFLTRFMAKTKINQETQCWEWIGAVNERGCGKMAIHRKLMYAHRFSLQIKLGRELGNNECACHHCDNPNCVNPDHLFAGTRSENTRDSMGKGRFVIPTASKGVKHNKSKLDPVKVQEIISLLASGESQQSIANKYGVAPSSIHKIHTGKSWKEVQQAVALRRMTR